MFKNAICLIAALFLVGCSGSTAVSRQPSQQEIDEAKQRRLKAIDDIKGLSPEARERMKQQVTGGPPPDAQKRSTEGQ